MAVDIVSIWNTCKTFIRQVKGYANAGRDFSPDVTGQNKAIRFLNLPAAQNGDKQQPAEVTKNNIPPEILNALTENFSQVMKFITAFMLQDDSDAFYGMILIDRKSVV